MRPQNIVSSMMLTVTVVLSGTLTANAQPFALIDAVCRENVAKGAQKLADTILKEKVKCEQLRLKQKLTVGTNCNDLLSPNFPGAVKVAKKQQKLLDTVLNGCAGAQDPQHNGYVVCPAPCNTIPITDYSKVAACIQCITDSTTSDTIAQTYGTLPGNPPVPMASNDPTVKCYNYFATGMRKYFSARFKAQQKCQFQADQVPPGPDPKACETDDPDHKVNKQLVKTKLLIAKCDPAVLATMTTCGTAGTTNEQNCVLGAADTDTDTLFEAIYIPPNGVFVSSSTGSAGGDGTIFNPINTITGGIGLATASKNTLFIDGGVYPESVVLGSNVILLAGFDSTSGWVRNGATVSVFGASTGALFGNSVSNVVIDGIVFSAAGNASIGGSSFGARLLSSTNVTIKNSTISAGSGGPGSNGSNGSVGGTGGAAGNGGNGCEDSTTFCSSCGRPGGGAGGTNGSCAGANGGGGGRPKVFRTG